ncbi:MAG TPA: hypothetical protein VLJ39_17985, partial [Tepidisphaeraceae bacterium]|nr:hypothetical protein [Tepidisphaeraceae bacterium]
MAENGLNIFQRLTRRWEAVHPYNAAQVMRISGSLDASRATSVWGDALRSLGLGRVRVSDPDRFTHEPINGELARFPVLPLPADTSLEDHLTTELNRRFDNPDEPPFRPFLLQRENDFYFGVVYQHWIADSVSIRAVLQEWFTRAFDPSALRGQPLQQPSRGYWNLFADRRTWRLDETLLGSFKWHMRHRRARKVLTTGPGDYPVRVTLHRSPAGLIDHLLTAARTKQVKVQDVLLAAMAEACDRFVPAQHRENRPDLAVGSIIDLRRHTGLDLTETFGLFLGFTNVVCRRQHLKNWDELLRSVASQNRGHKLSGPAQASLVWMVTALIASRFIPDHKLYHFYRKELPMLGGLSNVNLNDSWAARYYPDPLREYIRVSPTGPLVPLVFSTTTLGPRLTFALTCRQNLLAPETASNMADAFADRLHRVTATYAAAAAPSPSSAEPPPPDTSMTAHRTGHP